MKVLHVIGSLDLRGGGPIRAVLDLSAASEKYGIENEILGVYNAHDRDRPSENGLIHGIPLEIPNGYCYTPGLRQWLERNIQRFDCAILHGMWLYPTLAAARECRRKGLPYATFPHGMLEPWPVQGQGKLKYFKKFIYWHLFEKHIFRESKCSLFTTTREMALAAQVFGFPWPARIAVPFGITKPQSVASEPPECLANLAGRQFVLFLGRIHPKKNVPFLLSVWAKAMSKTDWALVIAGPSSGSHGQQVKQLAKDLDIEDKCVFLDFVSGTTKEWLFQNARWFVLPSQQENFGIAVFEAVARGCPVIVSDQVYSADLLEPNGRVLPLTEECWAEFFRTHLHDGEYRSRLVTSDAVSLAQYTMEDVARIWSGLVKELFNARAA